MKQSHKNLLSNLHAVKLHINKYTCHLIVSDTLNNNTREMMAGISSNFQLHAHNFNNQQTNE